MRILAFIAGLIALTVGFCHNMTRAEARAAQDAGTSPYLEESVTFTNGDVTLAGTLTQPRGEAPFPAVVLITGSGPQNRDTQVPPSLNRAPVEAALAQNGRVRVVEYPGANHLFQPAVTGLVTEYAALPKAFVPGLVDDLATWMLGVAPGR